MSGFLSHFDGNGVLSCFQEFLQGPCPDGKQFILSDEENDFEIICEPTNCDANESRVNNTCIPIPVCKSDEKVKFNKKSDGAKCVKLSGNRTSLFSGNLVGGGISSCPKGEKKDGRGNCKATVKAGGKNGKRSPAGYGGGKTLAQHCCS